MKRKYVQAMMASTAVLLSMTVPVTRLFDGLICKTSKNFKQKNRR